MRELRWMVVCVLAIAIAGCAKGAGPGNSADGGTDSGPGGNADASPIGFSDARQGTPDASTGTPTTVTLRQSSVDTIVDLNAVGCNNGTFHRDNRYFRIYDLPALGINSTFNVTTVHVGIENAQSNGGTQPADVRLHTLNGTANVANLSQLTTTPVTVADQMGAIIDVPISATVPGGSKLAVEFHTPDGEANTNLLFMGSNTSGETQPSYIVAPAAGCDLTDMTTPSAIDGALQMHVILKVTGSYTP